VVVGIDENISGTKETLMAVAKYVLITEVTGVPDKLKLDTTFEGTTTNRNRWKDDALVDKMDEGRRPKET
jgi:hypothetical protein